MKIKNQKSKIKDERGVALYLALMVMGVLLALALGISAILLSQTKVIKEMGNSVIAFYAANTGIERVLYIDRSICSSYELIADRVNCLKNEVSNIPSGDLKLDNGAQYELVVDAGGEGTCPSGKTYCVKSSGIYKETKRAIRIAI